MFSGESSREFGLRVLIAVGLAAFGSGTVWFVLWRWAHQRVTVPVRRITASALFLVITTLMIGSKWCPIHWGESFCATCGLRRHVTIVFGSPYVRESPEYSQDEDRYARRFATLIPPHVHTRYHQRQVWFVGWFHELPRVDVRWHPDLYDIVGRFERATPAMKEEILTSYDDMGVWTWSGTGYYEARFDRWKSGWLAQHPEFRAPPTR